MRVVAVIVLFVLIAIVGNQLDGDDKASKPQRVSAQSQSDLPGSDELNANPIYRRVYPTIRYSNNCTKLQETFDRNMDRYEMMDALARQTPGSTGEVMYEYADAALDRMSELGC